MHVPDPPGRLSPGEREELLGDEGALVEPTQVAVNAFPVEVLIVVPA